MVSAERGGGPLHFWLEHVLLGWWPGLEALRLPSLVFFVLALPAVALIARRLSGVVVASGVVLLVAVSPVPVHYSTFGRPHTMLFACLQWGTVLALAAADEGDRRLWAAAGAALGLTVFVHPTAPLYALTAFGAAVVYAWRPPRAVVAEAWPGAVALAVTFLPYYLATLHVLSDRYGVGSGRSGRTFSGRPVWVDAIHFLAPGAHVVNVFTVLAVLGAAALLARGSYRVLAFCALTIAAPVVFFSVVPTGGVSALFFDRYMIPATPAFLVLAVVAVAEIARLAGALARAAGARAGTALRGWTAHVVTVERALGLGVVVAAVAGLLVLELRDDLRSRRHVSRIHVDAVVRAVAHEPPGTVLFGSTGTRGRIGSGFDFGHPPNLLDHLVALRVPSLRFVDDDSCDRARPFLRGPQRPHYGLWLFYAASGAEARAGRAALGVAPVAGRFFVVRTDSPLEPRALIVRGQALRRTWKRAVPENDRVDELLRADRELLAGKCTPYGILGDPDISPHWPPLKALHQ